jgi:AhpD family alkylhydroperoxidase
MSEYLFKTDISKDMALLNEINPGLHQAWRTYHDGVFKDGALSKMEKELIAVAGAHITSCPYCIRSRVRSSKNSGATDAQVVESIYVAMRFAMGGPFAFSSIAFEAHNALDNDIPLTDGHFFKKNVLKEINEFHECSGENSTAFKNFTKEVFADGALKKDFKRGLVGLACAHMTKCPYCIRGCVKDARAAGYSKEQIAEAINIAMVMQAGACYAHTSLAMETIASLKEKEEARKAG